MEGESDEVSAPVPLRPTKRLKTVLSRPSKGKEKSEADPHSNWNPTPEEEEEEEEERCGICLTVSAQSIRGLIDSCNHHFCFVCVMEWAKIESRCPLCKQRFGLIRRPAVPGLFPSDRVVKISERNQVNHPLGIESSAVNNPHLDPNCTVCHLSEKDSYLLLCELCNSTCHSYCVGLGADIPEGEWYCPDCTIAKNEYLKTQPDDESPFLDQETMEKIRKIRQGGSSMSSVSDFVADLYGDSTVNSGPYTIRRHVRTLSRMHRREERMQRLCQNRDRLRSGELRFLSEVLEPNDRSGDGSGENTSTVTISSREADAIQAWKMMDKAKLVCSDRGPKIPIQSGSQPSKTRKVACHHKFWTSKPNLREIKGVSASAYSNPDAAYYDNGRSKFPNKGTTRGWYTEKVQQLGPMYGGFCSQFNTESNWRSRTGSCDGIYVGSSGLGKRRDVGMDPYLQERKVSATADRRDSVKDEVQTLVKLSLGGLNKDKKLGTDRFKEIARISTHTILAACGMEHSKSIAQPFSRALCNHHGEIGSHLLPGSCQRCFHTFLQEIVTSVFSEKNLRRAGAG